MIAKDESLFVKLVKKAVGLPTADSSCGCAAAMPAANACCNAEAPEIPSTGGGCDGTAHAEEDRPAETA